MSTWTSKVLLAVAGMSLAACTGSIDVGRAAPEVIAVAGRSVAVGGPPGYCVDRAASRDGVKAFVLLGSCASIARDPDGDKPESPGIMTVVVSSDPATVQAVAGRRSDLMDFFRSEAGRASLSRVGRAETVRVSNLQTAGGALYIRARDSSAGPLPGMSDDYWRALLDVNGRLVTISVIGFEDQPMSSEEGFRLIRAAADRVMSESARLSG